MENCTVWVVLLFHLQTYIIAQLLSVGGEGRGEVIVDDVDNRGGSRKKYLGGGWPLTIWEATTAKRNYYRTNYINQYENYYGLNYPEKIGGRAEQDSGGCAP